MSPDFKFSAQQDVLDAGVCGECFLLRGLRNRASKPEFSDYLSIRFEQLAEQYRDLVFAEDPVIAGFRALRENLGFPRRKYPASPENLIKRMLRDGKLPEINAVVDIYNLVSVESRLSIGAHDVDAIEGNKVTLKIVNGGEKFVPLGRTDAETVRAGEFAYVDGSNEIICRMEYRQCAKTPVKIETRDCFFIVQGNVATTADTIRDAANRIVYLTQKYCGGERLIRFPFGDQDRCEAD